MSVNTWHFIRICIYLGTVAACLLYLDANELQTASKNPYFLAASNRMLTFQKHSGQKIFAIIAGTSLYYLCDWILDLVVCTLLGLRMMRPYDLIWLKNYHSTTVCMLIQMDKFEPK